MHKILATCVLFLFFGLSHAQTKTVKDGYRIQVKIKDLQDSMAYLAHYFGKPLPTIYKTDSAKFDKNGVAVFESKEKVLGGIYMILLSDKKTYFELLLDNGDNISVSTSMKDMPTGLEFKNSTQNEQFLAYMNFLTGYGGKQQAMMEELAEAKTKADSAAVIDKSKTIAKELVNYRKEYVGKNPTSLLAKIFNALEMPQVPEGKHYLPDGKIDSNFGYNYYKSHYWDGFDFTDDRLINTPIYDSRLDEYMNKLVLPYEDSIIKEGNMLLAKTRGSKELFKYTLWWITRNFETSKIMGMDAVFVYFVENYYMKGDAYWLTTEELEKYSKRAREIAPNVIGNIAPDLIMQDIDNKTHKLSEVKSKYTLLIFWSPDCGHCKEEIPRLDSVYQAVLKKKGTKVYAVRTEGDVKQWQEFIKAKKLGEWINVYDPEHKSRFRQDYDVYSTPTIYLLDEKRIIRGKRIDHSNIGSLVEMLERKEKSGK